MPVVISVEEVKKLLIEQKKIYINEKNISIIKRAG